MAQILLETAWANTLHGKKEVKPWPWADTWPVARLTVPSLGISRIVLAGADGTSLAFGPGRLLIPTSYGTNSFIIVGHRDTHFKFLRELHRGQQLILQTTPENPSHFKITDHFVINEENTTWLKQNDDWLYLITCYPFDAIQTRTSQRYVITARKLSGSVI